MLQPWTHCYLSWLITRSLISAIFSHAILRSFTYSLHIHLIKSRQIHNYIILGWTRCMQTFHLLGHWVSSNVLTAAAPLELCKVFHCWKCHAICLVKVYRDILMRLYFPVAIHVHLHVWCTASKYYKWIKIYVWRNSVAKMSPIRGKWLGTVKNASVECENEPCNV